MSKITIICVEPSSKSMKENGKLGKHLTYGKISEVEIDLNNNGRAIFGTENEKLNLSSLEVINYQTSFICKDGDYFLLSTKQDHTIGATLHRELFEDWNIYEKISQIDNVNYFISAMCNSHDFFNNKLLTFNIGKCYFVKINKLQQPISCTIDQFIYDYNHNVQRSFHKCEIKKSDKFKESYHLIHKLI